MSADTQRFFIGLIVLWALFAPLILIGIDRLREKFGHCDCCMCHWEGMWNE